MTVRFSVLLLILIVGWSTDGSFITKKSHIENSSASNNNSLAAGESRVDRSSADTKPSRTSGCDPKAYSVEESTEPGIHAVRIARGGTVVHTIETPTGVEWNGFALDWAKKTKEGFEIAIEYGSVIFYGKRLIFICRQNSFI